MDSVDSPSRDFAFLSFALYMQKDTCTRQKCMYITKIMEEYENVDFIVQLT